jgi:hypothetical protein
MLSGKSTDNIKLSIVCAGTKIDNVEAIARLFNILEKTAAMVS